MIDWLSSCLDGLEDDWFVDRLTGFSEADWLLGRLFGMIDRLTGWLKGCLDG